jgi:hypothetical protein
MASTDTAERAEGGSRRLDEHGLLLPYTIKCLLLAGFLELVLYRLVSRLGMHLSKISEKHEWVRVTFKALSSIGFTLLNFTSLLVFLAISVLIVTRLRGEVGRRSEARFDAIVIPAVCLLLLLTIGFLIVPPAMLGSVVYNILSLAVVTILVVEYFTTHPAWRQRAMVLAFFLGLSGWFYYQIMSTGYGLLGVVISPPFVHEANRAGEAFMVLASILVFWAYAATPIWSHNRRQQRRILLFGSLAGAAFLGLLFLDYIVGMYSPAVATSVRKAGEGIGWIFQMGMGYTFYLPFAFYVAGLLLWSYTVSKLVLQGRPAGYGLAFMFIAGYALQLSHLTLLVVLGVMLLTLDRRAAPSLVSERVGDPSVSLADARMSH